MAGPTHDPRVPHPRQVPGYAVAAASGRVPPVPDHPPRLTVRPTARAAFHRFAAVTVGGALVVGVVVGRAEGALGRWTAPVLGLVSLVLLLGVLRMLGRVGDRLLAELRHGYTTFPIRSGGFWVGEGRSTRSGEVLAPWDHSGTWQLDHRDGRVLRAPDRTVDPPGMYPSPTRPNQLELWTGAVWLGHHEPWR